MPGDQKINQKVKHKTIKNVTQLYNAFLHFEENKALFTHQVKDIYPWELIRLNIFMELMIFFGLQSTAHDNVKVSSSTRWKSILNGLLQNHFFIKKKDVMFYSSARRFREPGGTYTDPYIDYYIQAFFPNNSFVIESPTRYRHSKPYTIPHVYDLDHFSFINSLTKRFQKRQPERAEIEKFISTLAEELENVFGFAGLRKNRYIGRIDYFFRSRNLFQKLIRRVSPKICFLITHYGKEAFVSACKLEGVPSVELQHGMITRFQTAYSFEKSKKKLFPDYLLVFGELWKNSVTFPIPKERIYPVGFPYLHKKVLEYKDVQKRKQILFISQGTIGKKLAAFAAQLRSKISGEYEIVYKLHPGEFLRWESEYTSLKGTDIVVLTDEKPIYELLSESMFVLSVYSSTLFEAPAFNAKAIAVEMPGIEYIESFIKKGFLMKAKTVNDVKKIIESDAGMKNSIEPDYIFDSRWEKNFQNFLTDTALI